MTTTFAETASHDYAAGADAHRLAHDRALHMAMTYDRQSAIAQDRKRDATAMLMAERAHGFHLAASQHREAAEILALASRSEGRS